jgi:AcrR family transcriptional regulator
MHGVDVRNPSQLRPYHHGDLRPTLVATAVSVISDEGLGAATLRGVARRAGVSHAAATYHFGDKAGLLTAVAAEGYRLLAAELGRAWRESASALEVGVAYVRFALDRRPYFTVMFQPDLLHTDDAELVAAKAVTSGILYGGAHPTPERLAAGAAAWSIVHGLATLWLAGNLPPALGHDPDAVTRAVAAHLRLPPGVAGDPRPPAAEPLPSPHPPS